MDKLVQTTGLAEGVWVRLKDAMDQYSTDIIQQENQKAVDSVQDLNTATEETETDTTVEIDASEAVTATEQVNGLGDAIAAIPRNVNILFSISNGSNSFYGKNNLNLTKFSARSTLTRAALF